MNNTADWNVTSCCHTFTNGSNEPEGGDGSFLRSVGKFLADYTSLLVLTSLETLNISYQTGCGYANISPGEICVLSLLVLHVILP
jgi:hypothetical protein